MAISHERSARSLCHSREQRQPRRPRKQLQNGKRGPRIIGTATGRFIVPDDGDGGGETFVPSFVPAAGAIRPIINRDAVAAPRDTLCLIMADYSPSLAQRRPLVRCLKDKLLIRIHDAANGRRLVPPAICT